MASSNISLISYNFRGYNQGRIALLDIVASKAPDVVLCQEHWLTPDNLCKFDELKDYLCIGSSAMTDAVSTGILRGRPFGGLMCLIRKNLDKITVSLHCSERYVIFRLGNCLIVNVYLPCVGTDNRLLLCEEIFSSIWSICEACMPCDMIIAGDFNCNLDKDDDMATYILDFCRDHNLSRCDKLCAHSNRPTYCNDALKHYSTIDYMLVSSPDMAIGFDVFEPDVNFSDHNPITALINCKIAESDRLVTTCSIETEKNNVTHLRWDHANLDTYRSYAFTLLQPIYQDLISLLNGTAIETDDLKTEIELLYSRIVCALIEAANFTVPEHRTDFYKYWWDQELDCLKDRAVASHRAWRDAGRPRDGPVSARRNADRRAYRAELRRRQREATLTITNDLH